MSESVAIAIVGVIGTLGGVAVGTLLTWYVNIQMERRRARDGPHRDAICANVLDPMWNELVRYSGEVDSFVGLGQIRWAGDPDPFRLKDPTDHPLYAQAGLHFPRLFEVWDNHERELKVLGELLEPLRHAVQQYLERETGLRCSSSSEPPPWFTHGVVRLGCCVVLGVSVDKSAWSEGSVKQNGGHVWTWQIPASRALCGEGEKGQMIALRHTTQHCSANAVGVSEDAAGAYGRQQKMERELRLTIEDARTQLHLSGKCRYCP